MTTRYRVLTRTLWDWQDCWTHDDVPATFATRADAERAIAEHVTHCKQHGLDYGLEDFLVSRVGED